MILTKRRKSAINSERMFVGYLNMGKVRSHNKKEDRVTVDKSKLNMGNTYSPAPEYYYDIKFTCRDCGSKEVWTAVQQKWWYEEAGGYFFAGAVRCRKCRKVEQERKRQARIQAGHEPGV